jgi:HK97 family phage major capsid protein
MGKLVELQEKRAAAWAAAKDFLESKRGDDGLVNADDTASYKRMEAGVLAMTAEIDQLEAQDALDTKILARRGQPLLNPPGAALSPIAGAKPATGRASSAYHSAFWNVMRTKQITDALTEGTDATGGYLVPDEFEHTLVQALEEHNIMRGLARVIRTSSGELQIPVVATTGTAAWLAEGASIPESDDAFGQVTLAAYKLGTMIKVSHELLQDSAFPLESFLAQDFGRRIGALEEQAFVSGDGSGKPTGFLTSAQVGKTTSGATVVTFDDVMDLYHSLKTPYRNKAVFMANDLTIGALQKLKDSNGQYLWRPALTMGEPDTILGRPVYVSSFMPQIAAGAKALAFGDFSYYWIADRQGRTFERLNELFAQTDQVGFKATQRVDGKLILPESVKVLQMGAA